MPNRPLPRRLSAASQALPVVSVESEPNREPLGFEGRATAEGESFFAGASPADMARALQGWFDAFQHMAVAFSGGVDSAVVADAAARSFRDRGILDQLWAVTGVGPAVSQRDREDARRLAAEIGIQHVWLDTDEIQDPDYQANLGRRCYYCKNRLYLRLHEWGVSRGQPTLANGTNRDDLGDFRPGLSAAQEHGVRSPLVELGFGKAQVRLLAQRSNLHVADKPASPCLASRIAPGVRVTAERLSVIERAEAFLRGQGIPDLRVRWYENALLRVEVPLAWIPTAQACLAGLQQHLAEALASRMSVDGKPLIDGELIDGELIDGELRDGELRDGELRDGELGGSSTSVRSREGGAIGSVGAGGSPLNRTMISRIEIDPRGLVSGGLNYLAKTASDKPPMVRDIHLGHRE